ncbi:MAG: response regulator [Deltaproteobacteria bacterium]|jgi:DNA-binding response OmpR family regulator|nr:response regulator [Deltaproteobacteria bacterium]MBW2530085.1 response regulator [Deltaproteobacteria bacterium]
MGLSSALERLRPADRSSSDAAAEFFQQLDFELPTLRQELLAEATAPIGAQSARRGTRIEDLAGRVRELAARATSFGHPGVADELGMCEAVLDGARVLGVFDDADVAQLEESLERIGSFLAAERERERTPTSGPVAPVEQRLSSSMLGTSPKLDDGKARIDAGWSLQVAPTVLVVAADAVADGLRDLVEPDTVSVSSDEAASMEIESVADPLRAPALARALAPDVVVVDLDLDGAAPLVEALLDGPLTATVPIVALGTWESAEQAAPLVALGVTRTLAKPVTPARLHEACMEVAANPTAPVFEPLGETNLDALGARLSEELQHGLCHAADDETRSLSVDLGQGTEVMAALWGAIGRIRELVSASSQGKVRFVPTGPEAALPTATWLEGGGLRPVGQRPPAQHEVRRTGAHSLVGRRIVVAEDDLSVNWYLSGVLRQAGAEVFEARDGVTALQHTQRHAPDLVISDILMPRLDGFSLCRALKADVALRDMPVILLSWKDDLLQRVRELDAGADGYLRKEASGATILRRVAELLRARSEVATRIELGGPVRGRLDGLTAFSLLSMVCQLRPNACLTVRDALFLYEVEVRSGRPVRATRTSTDGKTTAGPAVIAALLGAALGRFGVVDSEAPLDEQLEGTLEEQLQQPMAVARAAQRLLSGPALLEVDRVTVDEEHRAAYGQSSPASTRSLLEAIAEGTSPRELIQSGRASSVIVETVLGDAVRYGAVRSIHVGGRDALAPTAEREIRIQQGKADEPELERSLVVLLRAASCFGLLHDEPAEDVGQEEARPELIDDEDRPSVPPEAFCAEPPPEEVAEPEVEDRPLPVEPEPAQAAPAPETEQASQTPILASRVAVTKAYRQSSRSVGRALAFDPGAEEVGVPAPQPATVSVGAPVPTVPGTDGFVAGPHAAPQATAPAPAAAASPPAAAAFAVAPAPPAASETTTGVPMPSAFAPGSKSNRTKRSRARFLWPLVFGLAGISLAVGARWMREQPPAPAPVPAEQPSAPVQAPAPPVPATPPEESEQEQAKPHDGDLPRELPLAKGDEVGEGEGMLEVVAGKSDKIYVNGKLIGKGPVVKVTLKAVPDPYEVRVKLRGEERVRYAVVKEGKRVRLRIAPPWTR